jgi:hypothetical protein
MAAVFILSGDEIFSVEAIFPERRATVNGTKPGRNGSNQVPVKNPKPAIVVGQNRLPVGWIFFV